MDFDLDFHDFPRLPILGWEVLHRPPEVLCEQNISGDLPHSSVRRQIPERVLVGPEDEVGVGEHGPDDLEKHGERVNKTLFHAL